MTHTQKKKHNWGELKNNSKKVKQKIYKETASTLSLSTDFSRTHPRDTSTQPPSIKKNNKKKKIYPFRLLPVFWILIDR